jgi:hypothetical protein
VPDPRSFQTDLNQLAEAADVKLPELNELLQRQITALGAYSGVSGPTRTCGADSALFSLTGVLRQRAVRASQVIVATSKALHDIAEVYMRADGRTR